MLKVQHVGHLAGAGAPLAGRIAVEADHLGVARAAEAIDANGTGATGNPLAVNQRTERCCRLGIVAAPRHRPPLVVEAKPPRFGDLAEPLLTLIAVAELPAALRADVRHKVLHDLLGL